ncbi:maker13 [Drosophila busckii]|uniref:Maker13 n=1 Tax=Drosophila busckii TaxID=30019 RepID=A0A0M4EHZ1_DROBS|nr:maker13 [Drosophila busckii]
MPASSAESDSKTPADCARLKSEPNATSTPRISSGGGSSNMRQQQKYCGKLKHLSEEEATALMLKAVAEKHAAVGNNSNDMSYSEDHMAGGNSNDYPATLSGAVTFADVGGPAGLCHINILNSISAMNNLISGSSAGGGGGGNSSTSGGNAAGNLSALSSNSQSNNSGNGSGVDNGAGHPCPVCGRVYKLKSSLRNHQKWECGKEPQFQCPFCVYRAKQKMHIGRHMERMHKEKFKLDEVKSECGVGLDAADASSAAAAAMAAAAAAAALASSAPELHAHFTLKNEMENV